LAHSALLAAFITLLIGAAGCASHRDDRQTTDANSPDIWEMTIMAGRYSVMLSQARAILGLPEPQVATDNPLASDREGERKERRALARFQVALALEFFDNAAQACAKADAPQTIRALACSHARGAPSNLRTPPKPNLQSLSARNDAFGELIMPWWDATCGLAPKPAEGEDPICVME